MNKIIIFICLALMVMSCNKEKSGPASVEFQVNVSNESIKKSGTLSDSIYAAIVTIEDATGKKVYDGEKIELFNMNGYFISQPLTLTSGGYKLTQFIIVDKNNKILYATPVEGSAKAYLIKSPLPMAVNVSKDEVKKIEPETIRADFATPADFGYSTFGLKVSETLNFLFTAFEYKSGIKNYALTNGNLKIVANDTIIFDKPFDAKTNLVQIPGKFTSYKLIATKTGFSTYTKTFTKDSLLKSFDFPVKAYLTTGLDSGVVAYYPFDGNVNDASGNNNNGTISGASLTTDRFGHTNSAFYFNGTSNYIKVPTNNFKLQQLSISVWVKSDTLINVLTYTNSYDGYYGYALYCDPNTRTLTFRNVKNDGGNSYLLTSNIKVNNNLWHNIVITNNGAIAKIYVDNVLSNSTAVQPFVWDTNMNLYMFAGRPESWNTKNYTKGTIDDIRIYNRTLNDSEVKTLYEEVK